MVFASAAALALAGCAATPAAQQGDADGAGSDQAPKVALRVRVEGVRPGGGPIRAALYLDRASFLTADGIALGQSSEPLAESVELSWSVPAGTELVVSIFQDVDADGSLDRGLFGIPSEPWGFSGTPSPLLPPTWDACAIRPLEGDSVVPIALFGVSPRTAARAASGAQANR